MSHLIIISNKWNQANETVNEPIKTINQIIIKHKNQTSSFSIFIYDNCVDEILDIQQNVNK